MKIAKPLLALTGVLLLAGGIVVAQTVGDGIFSIDVGNTVVGEGTADDGMLTLESSVGGTPTSGDELSDGTLTLTGGVLVFSSAAPDPTHVEDWEVLN